MTVLTHLSRAKSIDKVSSTKKIIMDQEQTSMMKKELSDHNQNHGETTPKLNEHVVKDDESVNKTIQIKEEPPDVQPIYQTRCKLLNPYTLQWTNLTYLCVWKQVSTMKLLE